MFMNKRITVGITAHVDSGKTTLSEAILYTTGRIRKLGRVDSKSAFLDTHDIEKNRGITVFSHSASVEINGSKITLLDTPGHIDFSAETERTIKVLDYAILVINGAEGAQAHTETIWKLLERYNVPAFIFVNKMDMDIVDKEKVLEQLKERLSNKCVDFTDIEGSQFFEECAMCSEELMDEYLETERISNTCISEEISNRNIFPCYFGSALKLSGVEEFVDGLDMFTKMPEIKNDFGARVYKISFDEKGRRLTNLKICGGQLVVRNLVDYYEADGSEHSEKINEIRFYSGSKFESLDVVSQGEICAVTGLTETFAGQGLGCESNHENSLLEPIMSYSVFPPDNYDKHIMLENLKLLEQEAPELHVIWNEQLEEIQVSLMGEIQLEILAGIIKERFGIDVSFGQGSVAYKETIANTVEGVGHYEPLRHYAEVHLLMEPLERGKGLVFNTDCRTDKLDLNWQRLVLTHLEEKTHLGVLTGSPITDMKITLVSGKAHLKHTEGGDFRQATYRAVRNGLRKADSILLEPFFYFRLEVPSETISRAINDIQRMDAEFDTPETDGNFMILKGTAPASKINGYQSDVNSYTKGKGKLFLSFKEYAPCKNFEEVIERIGYNCDEDLANTADSIFCSHGSGMNVKWDMVEQYMHLPSCLKSESIADEDRSLSYSRAKDFCGRIADDEELMRIFEKTYGKINRDPRKVFAKVKKDTAVKHAEGKVYSGKEYLLVDGYNIIFSWDELKEIAKDNLDAARSRLENILCNYQGYRQCELILVFDAYKVKGKHREIERYGNINIVYTKEHETADTYIEKTTHQLGKENKVRVATSDGMEQVIILGNGALRVSAGEFYEEVKYAEKAIRDYIEDYNSKSKPFKGIISKQKND